MVARGNFMFLNTLYACYMLNDKFPIGFEDLHIGLKIVAIEWMNSVLDVSKENLA